MAPVPPGQQNAIGWWSLHFTPRVALVDEAAVLEVSASVRLFGGATATARFSTSVPDAARWGPLQEGVPRFDVVCSRDMPRCPYLLTSCHSACIFSIDS